MSYAYVKLSQEQWMTLGRWAEEHGAIHAEVTQRPQLLFIYYGHSHQKCVQVNRKGEARQVNYP